MEPQRPRSVAVAVLDDYQGVALECGPWERLEPAARVSVFRDHLDDEDALAERLEPFEVIVAMRERTPFRRSLLERLPRLELLVTTGMVNAAIDVDAARERGVTVCGTGHADSATAELTWALILGLVRHIHEEDAAVRAGGWQERIGPELYGRTLGVVGLGRQGTRVAGYGAAFGMEVLAWSQNLDRAHAEELGVEAASSLAELLTRSDVVTIHLRLSDRTEGLFGARELELIGPDGYLVNTSRGPIVDETALLEALTAGRIAGAALDVFDREPLPADHPLRSAPRTLLTPHIGYVATDNYRLYYEQIVEDIEGWLEGEPPRTI